MIKYLKNMRVNKGKLPKEIEDIFQKYDIFDKSIVQKFWEARYYLGDNKVLSPKNMWRMGMKNDAIVLAEMEAVRIKDDLDIIRQIEDFIKRFSEMELNKWEISEIPLIKIWLSCDGLALHLKSYKHHNLRESGSIAFELLENGDIQIENKKVIDGKATLGDICMFAKVNLPEATRIIRWFIFASRYDTSLFFKKCFRTSFINKPTGNSIIITSTGK